MFSSCNSVSPLVLLGDSQLDQHGHCVTKRQTTSHIVSASTPVATFACSAARFRLQLAQGSTYTNRTGPVEALRFRDPLTGYSDTALCMKSTVDWTGWHLRDFLGTHGEWDDPEREGMSKKANCDDELRKGKVLTSPPVFRFSLSGFPATNYGMRSFHSREAKKETPKGARRPNMGMRHRCR
ncbi:uncharacterized protein B0I36DRAFT_13240 [Microdochium trichocladiopsis]|uniref:Uncharacterized protein n=1 Tax=Microdochium trichocladiopsis TaxID=1682393 RepID=A0A9P8YKD7_9PEZI|nr:uncharacterized protein B0I36DRAFT_13240 [Microdochium trichocladiopsis]KAH7040630.1 hypothetical protein B0I36DRAFT_13240 [Microdochium trichocladiopsis]